MERGIESLHEAVEPHIRRLVELHHPDWTPKEVDGVTPRALKAVCFIGTFLFETPKVEDPIHKRERFDRMQSEIESTLLNPD